MTIHVKTQGGVLRAGNLEGRGEILFENNGIGQITKGLHARGKLNEAEGVCITYTNSEFFRYSGTFISGIMDGYVEIWSYVFTEPESEDEKKIIGNGPAAANGRRFIYHSRLGTQLEGTKQIVIYSHGVPGPIVSSEPCLIQMYVVQSPLNHRLIFSEFIIQRV